MSVHEDPDDGKKCTLGYAAARGDESVHDLLGFRMFTDLAWMNHAACRTADPELFFPIGPSTPAPAQATDARAVCGRCPVRPECLRYSLDTAQRHGIWGGADEDERRALRARTRS